MYAILDRPGIIRRQGRDHTAAGILVVSQAVIPRATLCRAFVTAKLGTMKGVEALEIVIFTAKLQDAPGPGRCAVVICVAAASSGMRRYGAMSS